MVSAAARRRIKVFEDEVSSPRWLPYHGFHEDHRERVGTPAYMPAIQQARSEFYELVDVLSDAGTIMWEGSSALQLGLGPCGASHEVWRKLFARVITIDMARCLDNDAQHPGLRTQSAVSFAELAAQYDFLFIDAGHLYHDVASDYEIYAPLVRPGGIIAFHDAVQRPDGIEVWRFLQDRVPEARIIGDEIGTAWIRR